jgi:hypothetical protein
VLAAPAGTETAAASRASAAAAEPKGWRPDVAQARQYAKRRTGDIRFAIVDPDRRRDDFHGGRTAPMASTVKVMLLAAYLRQRSVRDRGLNESDRDLLGAMIRRSDNGAATRVRNIVGESAIRRVARDAHMRHFSYNSTWGLCRTSAGDQASFMYRFEDTIPDRHEGYARNLLAGVVPSQRWGSPGRDRRDGSSTSRAGGESGTASTTRSRFSSAATSASRSRSSPRGARGTCTGKDARGDREPAAARPAALTPRARTTGLDGEPVRARCGFAHPHAESEA